MYYKLKHIYYILILDIIYNFCFYIYIIYI